MKRKFYSERKRGIFGERDRKWKRGIFGEKVREREKPCVWTVQNIQKHEKKEWALYLSQKLGGCCDQCQSKSNDRKWIVYVLYRFMY